ncbi:MAG: helix-hairpin-helix domain-containing protein, partial [Chitinophagaceae bacterium]
MKNIYPIVFKSASSLARIFRFLLFILIITSQNLIAQDLPAGSEQQLENLTETNEDVETEDDNFLQQMQQFSKNPLNLNTADANMLKDIRFLSALQIQNLINYRRIFGSFIDIYELQAIPAWDIVTIQKLLPYISVSQQESMVASLGKRFSGGNNSLLIRATQVLERSRGYLLDSSTAKNFYPGSPVKILLRYKYVFKNFLQYGITAEKDAGEQFFKGAQSSGFDFYSAHFFARELGNIKALALGDYTVSLGQGLIQWQSLAFRKSPDITATKRQAPVLKPYNSAGEIFFHRGAGITIEKKQLQATAFISYRRLDANFVADTLQNDEYISSFLTSGFHRTKNEQEDKNIQRQLSIGGNLAFNNDRLHLGINTIHYQFGLPVKKAEQPYNKFDISGKRLSNYSLDYSYTYRNLHFFGEAATDHDLNKAFINGLLVSADPRVDLSLVYRHISPAYKSLYTNAFTENTFPENERGLFAGISLRTSDVIKVDAYMDIYSFPYLKFNVDGPSRGKDFMVQLTYKPNKQVDLYTRFRNESKAINFNPDNLVLAPVINRPKSNWRTQVSFKASRTVTLRSRVEMLWFDRKTEYGETGFLTYVDFIYKPLLKPYSGSIRLQYFETDSYNSRLYAYENDVLYSFSIPVFYDKGYRYYINANYDLSKKLTLWLRFAQTISSGRDV